MPLHYAFGTAIGVVGLAFIVLEFVDKFDLPPYVLIKNTSQELI